MKQLREIARLTLAHLINDIYAPVLMALQPLLITVYGYGYLEAALLPVVHSLVSSLLQPVFGYLNDKKGLRFSVSLSILLSGLGVSLLGLVPDKYLVMLGCVAISGLGHASFHPGALCKVNAVAQGGNRGRLTSFFVVGGSLGMAVGPIIAGIFLTSGGIPMVTFLIIPAVLGALLLYLHPIPDLCTVTEKPANAPEEDWKPVLILFSGSTLRSWVTFGAMTFLPTYLVLEGYPLIEATTLVSIMLITGVFGQICGGILSDRFGRKQVVVITTFAAVPAFYGILIFHGLFLIASMMIFGFLLWSSFAVTIAMSHELIPSQVGLISGLFLGIAMGAGGIGVSISGYLADSIGLEGTLSTFPVITLFAGFIFLLVRSPRLKGSS